MALLERQLVVKRSTIPGAGKGLFTKKLITKGTCIVEYKGSVHAWKDVKDEDGKNAYLMYLSRRTVINALHRKKALARYVNDARGLTRVEGIRNNAEYITEGRRCFLYATRDIPPNSEILASYGRAYWTLMRKLAKKKSARKLK